MPSPSERRSQGHTGSHACSIHSLQALSRLQRALHRAIVCRNHLHTAFVHCAYTQVLHLRNICYQCSLKVPTDGPSTGQTAPPSVMGRHPATLPPDVVAHPQ